MEVYLKHISRKGDLGSANNKFISQITLIYQENKQGYIYSTVEFITAFKRSYTCNMKIKLILKVQIKTVRIEIKP